MAKNKFLDTSGVGRLWSNVVRAIGNAVNAEATRAKAEEARIEEKIAEVANHAYVEGDGIDITVNEDGEQVISLESQAITDEHIESISISKIVVPEGEILVLNGGSIDE